MESRVVPPAPWLDAAADTVVVSGPDALSYLHSQLSQDIRDLAVGEARWTFVLQPTGKIDTLARVRRTGDETYEFDTDPGAGALLEARLARFKIRVKADIELRATIEETPVELEQERIERGWPRMGAEIVPGETIPAETGLTPVAVDFRKGCYPGQELVERMDSRGAAAPRSLRRLDADAGVAPGDPVLDEAGAEVGWITSVSGTTALGYVKRGAEVGEPIVHS